MHEVNQRAAKSGAGSRWHKLIAVLVIAGSVIGLSACGTSDNHIVRFVHVNINCSDLERSRAFYELLGFVAVQEGESSVSAEFAAALNMPPYTLRYAQIRSDDGSYIDLIEWEDPCDGSDPYASANHLGIARLTLATGNLRADITRLGAQGVEFFSEPATVNGPSGPERIAVFRDPDGTLIELRESSAADGNADDEIHISGIARVNINCSDYERSRPFYEKLGYSIVTEYEDNGSAETAAAYGVEAYAVRGALMELRRGGPELNLLHWEDPYDNGTPYAQLNHPGIARMALKSTDLDADIARLKSEGVEFFSGPVRPDGELSFMRVVFFTDPDGTVVELVEMFPGAGNQLRSRMETP